jgi:hypothetical protein
VTAAEPVAHTLVGAAEGLTDWWLGRGADEGGRVDGDPAAELGDMLMAIVWPGLGALRRPVAESPGRPAIAAYRVVSDES